MAIITQCTSCGASASVPDNAIGRTVKCPKCSSLFTVAAAAHVAPRRPPPPQMAEPDFEMVPPPSRRQAAARERSGGGGGVLGCLGFIMGGLALIVALGAMALTWFRPDPLGSGLKKYNFTTPREAMISQIKMNQDHDIRAFQEMNKVQYGKKDEEKLRTLDVRKEVDWNSKKVLFYAYDEDGKKRYNYTFFVKDANTGYWLPSYDDYRWREDIRRDNPALAEWLNTFNANGEFRDPPKKFNDDWKKDKGKF